MQTLYLTCTILSMIWTLGDFNSVYLLTGGGPADLTHVLATLGIRYLRLDAVDLSMATIVCALPLVLPLVYFMMKTAVEMKVVPRLARRRPTRPELLLIGIPVLLWTMLPIYHLFLFAISPRRIGLRRATSGRRIRRCTISRSCFGQKHYFLSHFWQQLGNSLLIAVATGAPDPPRRDLRRLRDQPAAGARRPHS